MEIDEILIDCFKNTYYISQGKGFRRFNNIICLQEPFKTKLDRIKFYKMLDKFRNEYGLFSNEAIFLLLEEALQSRYKKNDYWKTKQHTFGGTNAKK